MASRPTLHDLFKKLLGNQNVYYHPPSSVNMQYPAIRYSKKNIGSKFANNKSYIKSHCYEVVVIDYKPDNEVIDKILELPCCSYNRHYVADNLNHDVLTLYY